MVKTTTKRSKKRIKCSGEVFTPDSLVLDMIAKLPKESWEPGKTFLDPACGNGQFLTWILRKKIGLHRNPTEALKTVYGLDIMEDNVRETRLNLLAIIDTHTPVTEQHVRIVMRNIFWTRKDQYPNGALDYHHRYDHRIKKSRVKKLMNDFAKRQITFYN